MSNEKLLHLRSIIGLNKSVSGNLFYMPLKNVNLSQEQGENNVLSYICGNTLVLKNLHNEKDFFISPGSISKGITSIKVFPDEKYFGMACQGEKNPFILIYDIGHYHICKTIPVPDCGSKEVISIDRSKDNKILIAQGGHPEYRLSIWFFHDALKMKKVCGGLQILDDHEAEMRIFKSSVSGNGKLICVTGDKVFRLYKVEEGKVSLIRKEMESTGAENLCFLTHYWLNDKENRLIVANAHGNLFLIENNNFKKILNCSPSNQLSINQIVKYENAFVVGGEDGYITTFEKAEDNELFKKQKTFKIPNNDNLFNPDDLTVANLEYDVHSGNLLVSTKAGCPYSIRITGSIQLKDSEFEELMPFHFRKISGIDLSIKKPFIVTCSLDKTIIVYNYSTSEIEIFKKFQMEAHSITIHPTGFYLIVGFTDKLRFFKILGKELREEKSYPIRNCCDVKFCDGGHLFAAAHVSAIHVYNSYTFEHLYSLRNAHTGKITHLSWKVGDTHITSVDANGNIVEFQLKNETKVWDYTIQDCNMNCVVSTKKSTFVSGNDKKIHVFIEQVPLNEFKSEKYSFTSLALSMRYRYIIGGKEDGSIWVYNQTNINDIKDMQFNQSGPINKVIVNQKGAMLITVSEDCSLCIFEIRERDREMVGTGIGIGGGGSGGGGPRRIIEEWDEEILISKNDAQAKSGLIRELELKCQDLKSDNEYNQIKKQLEFNNIFKQQAQNFTDEMGKRNFSIQSLEKEIEEKKLKYESERKERNEIQKKEIYDLEYQYNERIQATLKQLQDIETGKTNTIKDLLKKGEEQEFFDEEEKRKRVEEIKKDNEIESDRVESLKREKQNLSKSYSDLLAKTKKEQLEYVEKNEDEYGRKLRRAKNENEKLLQENADKTTHEKRHDRDIQKLQNEIREKQNELKKKKEDYEQKDRETNSIQKENEEREDTISEKDRRIADLNRQNKELKKFRFVLNYKIETLQNEINPNNETIMSMKKELTKYDREIQKYQKEKLRFQHVNKDLERKIHGSNIELQKMTKNLDDLEHYKSRMRVDIHEVVQKLDSPKLLKKGIVAFYHKHASPFNSNAKVVDMDIQKENDRKRTHLEKTVESLKKKLVKAKNTTKQETQRIMHENVMLINEINQLRKELRFLNRRLHEKINYKRSHSITDLHGPHLDLEQASRILDMQKMEITTLRRKLHQLENEKRESEKELKDA